MQIFSKKNLRGVGIKCLKINHYYRYCRRALYYCASGRQKEMNRAAGGVLKPNSLT